MEVQTGEIPERWLRLLLRSEQVLPYAVSQPCEALVPFGRDGRFPDPERERVPFWQEIAEIYEVHRGLGKSTPKMLHAQFDYLGKLSAQPAAVSQNLCMVVYPASADIMCATRTSAGVMLVDSTLYWSVFANADEAAFVTALLNAPCLNRAFSESRESGRDFHLHLWRKVPLPAYDRRNEQHRELVHLCAAAEKIAGQAIIGKFGGQKELRKIVRDELYASATGHRIDAIAGILMPEQAS